MARDDAARTGKSVPVPFQSLNRILSANGAPGAFDYDTFSKTMDASSLSPELKNIVDNLSGRFSDDGIIFDPPSAINNQPDSPGMMQQPIDPEHNTVKQTAMHALKSK